MSGSAEALYELARFAKQEGVGSMSRFGVAKGLLFAIGMAAMMAGMSKQQPQFKD